MTNLPPEAGNTQFWTVIIDEGFPFSFVLSWGTAVAVLVGAIVISIRWLIKRTPNRDPTTFAGSVIVQTLLFLLLNTVIGIRWMTAGVATGVPDTGLWYLCLAQVMGSILGNTLLCLFALAIVCFTSRRLPRPAGATVLPVAIVLLDLTVLLMWTTHALTMKK